MAWTWDDHWLWLGLAALLLASSQGIAYGLRDISRLSAINDSSVLQSTPENDVEDAISLEALHTLSKSVNPDIANAATSHLISRFAQSDADCDALTLELFSPFQHTRKRARQVLDLIDSHNHFNFWKPDVLRGERVQELRDVSKGNPKTQSMCLAFFKYWGPLRQGIGSLTGVADAVEAAWSAPSRSYPPSLEPTRRYARLLSRTLNEQEALAGYSEAQLGPADQTSIAQIVTRADGSGLQRGRNLNDHSEDLEYEIDEQSLAQLVARPGGAALPLGRNVDGSRRARFHEESPEETEVRRRRREAMVFHEGSGALGRDDIIQPRSRMP